MSVDKIPCHFLKKLALSEVANKSHLQLGYGDMTENTQNYSQDYSTALWLVGRLLLAVCLLLPLGALAILAVSSSSDIWEHLWQTILVHQIMTTLYIMLGVAFITAGIGTITAWLISFCVFPTRRFFGWGLLLPLSIPTYLAAYSYSDLLDSAGVVAYIWRGLGLNIETFPNIYSLGGGIFTLAFVLFPYVYISARAAFIQQSAGLLEAARLAGLSPFACFWRVSLAQARPAIIAGVALTLMECLNDIGAMEHLGIETLTIGIYDTWVVRGSLGGAAQMALTLLIFIGALLYIERKQRGNKNDRQHYAPIGGQKHELARFVLSPAKSALAILTCFIPMALGFLVPFAHLIYLANTHIASADMSPALMEAAKHSLILAISAAVIVSAVGLFLAFGNRLIAYIRNQTLLHRLANLFTQIAALGYAIPATILGLGILIALFEMETPATIIFISSGAALLFAYVVRFLPLAFHNLEAGFDRIALSQDMAARGLGAPPAFMLAKIHIPHLRAPLMVAALLVFVDVMKELPATLILRPFNFDTLASLAYTQASLGQLEAAALPACMIIIVGLLPILILLSQLDMRLNK